MAEHHKRVLFLRAYHVCDGAAEQLRDISIVLPPHQVVSRHHPYHIVAEEDHYARSDGAFELSKLDHPHVEVANTEWVAPTFLVIESVTIFGHDVGEGLGNVAPRLLPADPGVEVADRHHVVVADHNDVVVDQEF